MANDSVNIPVSLEVEEISLGQVDLKDVEQKLSQKVSGIVENIEKIMGNTDTSKFNKALESSFNSMERSYNKVQTAQAKYNDAMKKAGESSEEYKAKLSEVKSEMKAVQDKWNAYNDFMGQSYAQAKKEEAAGNAKPHQLKLIKVYEEELAKYEKELSGVQAKMPNPLDYVSSGSESATTKVTQSYRDVLKAIEGAEKAQKDWNTSLKENRASDEYMKMAQEIQTAEQKLVKLQEKATKMESLGASDKQWESLIYEANLLSKSITDNEAKMRKLVRIGQAFRFGDGGSAKGQEFMKLTGILARTQKAMQGINNMKPNTMYSEEYAKQVKELEALERKLMSYREKYQKMQTMGATGTQWQSFLTDSSMLEGKIEDIIAKLQEMISTGKAFKLGTGDATAETDALNERLTTVTSTFREMENAPKNTKTNFMGLVKVINNFCNSAKKGLANVISMFKKLGKTGEHTSNDLNKSLKNFWKNILMFGLGFRSTFFLVRRLRSTFIESFKEMATQIPEVNGQVSSFMTSVNQLKGSLATAFQPIVSAIIPWLNQLCAALNSAMNALARFFATLTGQGYIYKFTAAQVDYADSLGNTGSAAKKAQKDLMGFDEINRLSDKSDSGGGGGGGGGTPTGTWEKEMLDGMSTLAEMIKEAWTDGDFYEVGQYIGEKLLGALKVADEWITTKGYGLAEKIGKSLATLLNGIIETQDLGTQLGKTIADGINMGMIGIHKFFTTTNWLSLGQFIADWANASVKNFKWDLLGQTIASVITAAVNTWWKFVGEFDFSALGNGIATAINNLFDNVLAVDDTGLNSAQKLGQAITNTVRGILTTLTDAINNTDWSSVGQTIGEVLANIDWSVIVWDFTKLVGAIVKALAEAFVNWTATDPLSAGMVTMLGLAFTAIDLGGKITGLILQFSPLISLAKDLGLSFKDVVQVVGGWAKTFGGVMSIVSGAITFFTNFFAMLNNGFSWVNEALMLVGAALAAVGAVLLGAPAAVAAVVAGIVAAVATLVVLVKQHWTEIWAFIKSVGVGIGQTIKALVQTVVIIVTGLIGAIKTILDTIVAVVASIIAAIVGAVKSALNVLIGIIASILTAIAGVITGILDSIRIANDTVLKVIKELWSTVLGVMKDIVTGNFNNIRNTINTGINNIRTIIQNGINAAKNVWSNVWNAISTITKSIWNGISNTIKGTINDIVGFVNGMIRGIVSGMNSVIRVLNKFSVNIPDWVPELGGKKFGFSLNTISAPQIPKLAQGGVIPPNNEFMAILGDQKHGTNIEAPLDTIKQAVAEELAEYIDAMMTGFQAVVDAVNDKDFDVRIGDNAIGKAAERYSKRQALIRGTT